VIAMQFAGNASLASHLSSSSIQSPNKSRLSGANGITKIIVGIALAMRFVSSQGIIHRDLKPENILLDWDWIVRIADFGHSRWQTEVASPSLPDTNPIQSAFAVLSIPIILLLNVTAINAFTRVTCSHLD
jgi:serine/threonine protein kinase